MPYLAPDLLDDTLLFRAFPFAPQAAVTGDEEAMEKRFERRGPYLYLASDLFAALGAGRRPVVKDLPLNLSAHGISARFTGERLDQRDLDVLLALGELALGGTQVRFRLSELAVLLSRETTRAVRRQLAGRLERLQAAQIEVSDPPYTSLVRLVHTLAFDADHEACQVELSGEAWSVLRAPGLVPDLGMRLVVDEDPLAKWLYTLVCLNPQGFLAQMPRLRALSGSRTRGAVTFTKELRQALDRLAVSGAVGDWELGETGLLRVTPRLAGNRPGACRVYF